MSNRTLIEISHDFAGEIDRAPTGALERVLLRYLRSGDRESAMELGRYGIRVFGMRHHSDAFEIAWGGLRASEPSTKITDLRSAKFRRQHGTDWA